MDFTETFIGRPNTVRTYTSLFKNHIEPHLVPADPQRWIEDDTLRMVNLWTEKKLAPRTIQTLLRLVTAYVRFNGGPKLDTTALCRKVSRMRQDEEMKVLNNTQAKHLMDVCRVKDRGFYPILLLGLHAGLRRGEIFGLSCEDVDPLKGRIRVAHSYEGPTKNGKTRCVPMSKDLANVMISTRNLTFRESKSLIFERLDPNPRLRRLLRAAHLPEISFHGLRHTFATLALEAGKSPKEVQMWLGHSNVSTTLSIYWNVLERTSTIDFMPEAEAL